MVMSQERRKAVAYLRTSSKTNVGPDKDSDKRQLAAIEAHAKAHGFDIVATFYDAAVSGADPVTDRPGFAEMLERLMSNGARTIIVESPDRFARDLMVQLAGHDMLKAKGITLIAASAPTFFLEDTPTAVLVRQVLGAIAQFEKAGLVAKLAAARKRKRMATGKCEGRKSHAEVRPETVALAKHLARKRPKGAHWLTLARRVPRQGQRQTAARRHRGLRQVGGVGHRRHVLRRGGERRGPK